MEIVVFGKEEKKEEKLLEIVVFGKEEKKEEKLRLALVDEGQYGVRLHVVDENGEHVSGGNVLYVTKGGIKLFRGYSAGGIETDGRSSVEVSSF